MLDLDRQRTTFRLRKPLGSDQGNDSEVDRQGADSSPDNPTACNPHIDAAAHLVNERLSDRRPVEELICNTVDIDLSAVYSFVSSSDLSLAGELSYLRSMFETSSDDLSD